MTYEEIKTRLGLIVKAMMDKNIKTPDAQFSVRTNAGPSIYITCGDKAFDGDNYKFIFADAPEDALSKADALIASMVSGEEKVLRTYLGKLADAVDYGHENGIAAEYVDPVRITQKAMTENLLSPPTTINPKSQECDHPFCGDDCGAAVDAAEPAEGV